MNLNNLDLIHFMNIFYMSSFLHQKGLKKVDEQILDFAKVHEVQYLCYELLELLLVFLSSQT